MSEDTASGLLEQLIGLCASANASVLLAAPFIKADIVARLVGAIADDIEVTFVTRWHANEIAAQVSDLDVWPIVRGREKSGLLLQQHLHAKYYRGDQDCLIGSANLTASALAGADAGNLELLVGMGAEDPQLRGFESRLLLGALPVDDGLYDRFCALVADLRPEVPQVIEQQTMALSAADWYPQFRMPAELFRVYRGSDHHSADVLDAARHDLLALAPPPGLGQRAFEAAVGIALQGTDLVRSLDAFLGIEERRFGEVRAWVAARIGRADDEGMSTQCLIRWLLAFLPDRYLYRRPGYSELLSLRTR